MPQIGVRGERKGKWVVANNWYVNPEQCRFYVTWINRSEGKVIVISKFGNEYTRKIGNLRIEGSREGYPRSDSSY